MTIYYSPSQKGFFDTSKVDYPALPGDVIEITEQQHATFIEGLNLNGKELVLENGTLKLKDYVHIPTWDEVRLKRNRLLGISDFTQMPDYPGDQSAWATYRQLLRDIPQTFTNPEDVVWPVAPGE